MSIARSNLNLMIQKQDLGGAEPQTAQELRNAIQESMVHIQQWGIMEHAKMEKFHLDFEKQNVKDAYEWFHSRWHTMQAEALETIIQSYHENEQNVAENLQVAFSELVTFQQEMEQIAEKYFKDALADLETRLEPVVIEWAKSQAAEGQTLEDFVSQEIGPQIGKIYAFIGEIQDDREEAKQELFQDLRDSWKEGNKEANHWIQDLVNNYKGISKDIEHKFEKDGERFMAKFAESGMLAKVMSLGEDIATVNALIEGTFEGERPDLSELKTRVDDTISSLRSWFENQLHSSDNSIMMMNDSMSWDQYVKDLWSNFQADYKEGIIDEHQNLAQIVKEYFVEAWKNDHATYVQRLYQIQEEAQEDVQDWLEDLEKKYRDRIEDLCQQVTPIIQQWAQEFMSEGNMVERQNAVQEVMALLGEYQPKLEGLPEKFEDLASFKNVEETVLAEQADITNWIKDHAEKLDAAVQRYEEEQYELTAELAHAWQTNIWPEIQTTKENLFKLVELKVNEWDTQKEISTIEQASLSVAQTDGISVSGSSSKESNGLLFSAISLTLVGAASAIAYNKIQTFKAVKEQALLEGYAPAV